LAIKGSGDPLCFNLLQELAPMAALVSIAPLVDWGEVPQIVWILLAATGVTHGAYFFWMSRAYEHGDLNLVYPIARSTPAFVPLVAGPLFGESISPGGGVGIAIVVVGIWLVHAGGGGDLRKFSSPAARFAYLTLMATVGYSLLDKAAMANLAAAEWSSVIPRPVIYSLLIAGANTVVFAPLVLRARGLAAVREAARTQLGRATDSTILGGVVLLIHHGDFPIAAVIFIASVLVPLSKLMALSWLCWSVWRGHPRSHRERARLYRATELVGKWSMTDVFVVAILVALIHLGGLLLITPGPAAIAFGGVVVVTMIAAHSFDPRLIWDQLGDADG